MLTETLCLSTLAPPPPKATTHSKDLGIHLHTYQPYPGPSHSFKKSSTHPNCLAVSATHIFAAQAEKAVVHVYSREHGNQEAIVPFPEKIRSLALAGEYEEGVGCLVLGAESGKVLVWELATGHLVTTPPSHVQPVTVLAVPPNHLHALSGAGDAQIHLWSLPSLLSFSAPSDGNTPSHTPVLTLSSHRGAITALTFGHSHSKTNIAVSASEDKTIIIWDYLSGTSLHTFLLSSPALCLTLDPADRALYAAGSEDGSIQFIPFFTPASPTSTSKIHDPSLRTTPTQPPEKDRWRLPISAETAQQRAHCLTLSHDGTVLLSGHASGKLHAWDISKARFRSTLHDYTHPVTNLTMLPPTGWPNPVAPRVKLHRVIKPRYESTFSANPDFGFGGPTPRGGIPSNYTFTASFPCDLPPSSSEPTSFHEALTHPSFPTSWLEEGLSCFSNHPTTSEPVSENITSLQEQNELLKRELSRAQDTAREALRENLRHDGAMWRVREEARMKREGKRKRRLRLLEVEERRRKRFMGEEVDEEGDEGMEDGGEGEEEGLSSDTDEVTDTE